MAAAIWRLQFGALFSISNSNSNSDSDSQSNSKPYPTVSGTQRRKVTPDLELVLPADRDAVVHGHQNDQGEKEKAVSS